MIKVLQVLSGLNFGGVQSVVLNYYKNIDKSKVQFDFAVMDDKVGELESIVKELGAKIYRFPNVYKQPKAFSTKFLQFLKEHKEYKIVHAHMNFQNVYILKCAKKAKVKMRISHSHSTYKASNILMEFMKKIAKHSIVRNATNCWACSEIAGEWLYGKAVNSEKFHVIKNAIEVEKFAFSEHDRIRIRRKYGVEEGESLFIHTGSFSDAKNHIFLLKVFFELQKNMHCRLMLVGDGTLKDLIVSETERLGISQKIILVGKQNNVAQFLSAADAFVFPSVFEGLPVSVVEAQANGLPCFLSRAVPKEAIFTEKCICFDGFDETVWQKGIKNGLESGGDRQRNLFVNAECDIKVASVKLVELYMRGLK